LALNYLSPNSDAVSWLALFSLTWFNACYTGAMH